MTIYNRGWPEAWFCKWRFMGAQPRPIVYILSLATSAAELSSCSRHSMACKAKNVYYLVFHPRSLLAPALYASKCPEVQKQTGADNLSEAGSRAGFSWPPQERAIQCTNVSSTASLTVRTPLRFTGMLLTMDGTKRNSTEGVFQKEETITWCWYKAPHSPGSIQI